MSKESLKSVLDAARRLPLDEQKQLVEQLLKEVETSSVTPNQILAAVEAVERTRGAMQGLDRDAIIQLA